MSQLLEPSVKGGRKVDEGLDLVPAKITRNQEEIMTLKPPKQKWYVKGLFPHESVLCLYGEPKIGKSWLCYQLSKSIVDGRGLFGNPTSHRGNVLYWPLEDNTTRLQLRMTKHDLVSVKGHEFRIPMKEDGAILKPQTYREGFEILERVIKESNPSLTIIDSLLAFGGFSNVDFYRNQSIAPMMKKFIELRDNYHTGILAVHHSRKKLPNADDAGIDEMYGGRAISALADGIIRLWGRKDERKVTFDLRDGTFSELPVVFDSHLCRWRKK